ncbi:hypothetical protein SAMN04487948_11174 [Halogranum amylolyticum]|uniref:Uncharacterized protein n=1 Tax=Halogranum amylolyticum TaxID=660520 RepID=A0A1H8UJP9_9EURY|nr:hypothetical protein SAMN04487948_11174 [Halogranum amylolyticum]
MLITVDVAIPRGYGALLRLQNAFEQTGLEVGVIEGGTPLTDTTRLGLGGGMKKSIDSTSSSAPWGRSTFRCSVTALCYKFSAKIFKQL